MPTRPQGDVTSSSRCKGTMYSTQYFSVCVCALVPSFVDKEGGSSSAAESGDDFLLPELCVCVCVCVCVKVYVCVYMYEYFCMHTCVCTLCIYIYICVHVCTRTHAHTRTHQTKTLAASQTAPYPRVPRQTPSPPPPTPPPPPPPQFPRQWTCRSTPWDCPAPRIWDWPEDLRLSGCHWKRLPPPLTPPCSWRRSHREPRLVVVVSAACPPSCLYDSGTESLSDPPAQKPPTHPLSHHHKGHLHSTHASLVTSSHRYASLVT
jgi:hypothetical protein